MMAVRGIRLGMHFSRIADPGAAIFYRIGVDTLAITSGCGTPIR